MLFLGFIIYFFGLASVVATISVLANAGAWIAAGFIVVAAVFPISGSCVDGFNYTVAVAVVAVPDIKVVISTVIAE